MSSLLNRAVVFACDFKPRVVGGLQVMPNHGRAGGAPTWLTLGDGSTAGTIPIPLAGYGASFTGSQYVNTGVVDRYEHNNTFSPVIGTGYAFGIFDGILTPRDIGELDTLVRGGIR